MVGSASMPFLPPGSVWLGLADGGIACSFFTLPFGLWMAAYLCRASIVADAAGSRWREAGRWRIAAWSDVVACYDTWERKPKSSGFAKVSRVETRRGTLVLSPDKWTNEEQLRAYIGQYASETSVVKAVQNALQSADVAWGVQGGPLDYLPLKCHYATIVNRNLLNWLDSLHKYGLLAVAIYFVLQWLTTHTLPGWGWLLTPTGLFVVGKQILPLVLRPTYRATQPRLSDKVFADRIGLRFVDAVGETAVPWEDITSFYTLGIRSVVVTASGEYDFLETLTSVERLKAVIACMTSNADQTDWQTGTVPRQQVSQAGEQHLPYCFYGYRSLTNCGQLWAITLGILFLSAVTLGPALIAWQSGSTPTIRELAAAMLGALGLTVLLWLWASYWVCGVRTDAEGITEQTMLGNRHIAWSQVRGFRWRGSGDSTRGYVDGLHDTIKFWKGIGDADRLADEITAHLNTTY